MGLPARWYRGRGGLTCEMVLGARWAYLRDGTGGAVGLPARAVGLPARWYRGCGGLTCEMVLGARWAYLQDGTGGAVGLPARWYWGRSGLTCEMVLWGRGDVGGGYGVVAGCHAARMH